jgi:hypothetical protein
LEGDVPKAESAKDDSPKANQKAKQLQILKNIR